MPTRPIPERLRWAVETMAVQPADRILEIGCGRGVAVALVCERLVSGRIVAIDRSPTMAKAAAERNRECIEAGKAVVHTTELAGLAGLAGLGERFDKAFAVNVNLFWVRSPATELALLKRLLAPTGTLYLFYEPPEAARAATLADQLVLVLTEHGFAATVRMSHALLGVVARPT